MFFDFDDFDVRDRFYQIEEKTQKLTLEVDSQSLTKQEALREMCMSAYVFHDSALDGVVVSNEEILSIIGSQPRGHYVKNNLCQEIRNHKQALELVGKVSRVASSDRAAHQSHVISVDQVIDLHRMLYQNLARKEPGQLRRVMPLHSAYCHNFEEPQRILGALAEACKQTEHQDFRAQHPINQAVLFHQAFMKVLPFNEGSGKVGRLFMNAFLIQGGYEIAIIHGSERQRYYENLRDGPEKLRELLLDSMESALDVQLKYLNDYELPMIRNRLSMRGLSLR